MTREYGKLKFDPIKFKGCHNDGTIGTKGAQQEFLPQRTYSEYRLSDPRQLQVGERDSR